MLFRSACKAGGELNLGTYQVAWAGRPILASRIQKHYISENGHPFWGQVRWRAPHSALAPSTTRDPDPTPPLGALPAQLVTGRGSDGPRRGYRTVEPIEPAETFEQKFLKSCGGSEQKIKRKVALKRNESRGHPNLPTVGMCDG